ncbi:N-acetyltransferase [Rummeliibacillus sp. TYF005]|uniref:GNAT family protein n=1 Tax=Rummeliibacillus sp. TYF005 TaxID=2058214 RepID=UPI000F5256B6|nr:GNAT family protein [Rummeliibacillus sp. TYF005]RPJ96316.1 N-acetyltransferase [Rummeliibacillus sp. TYF005]
MKLNKTRIRVEVDNQKAIKKMGYVEEVILRHDYFTNGKFVDRLRISILNNEFLK